MAIDTLADGIVSKLSPVRPSIHKIKITQIVLASLLLMFIGDAANAILLRTGSQLWRISIFIRAIIMLCFILLLLKSRLGVTILLFLSLILSIFFIGALNSLLRNETYYWFENINLLAKMSFFFIFWVILRRYFYNMADKMQLFRLFEFIVIVETLTILLGFIFKIELFSSYGQSYRFGYKGLIPARNELSGFFIIAFFYFLWKVDTTKHGIAQLFITLIASLLTGAKVLIIFPLIMVVFLFIWFKRINIHKNVFFCISFSLVALSLLSIWQRQYLIERITPSIDYFTQQLTSGNNPNIFSLVMSGRDLYIRAIFNEYISNFNVINFLIGGHTLSAFSTETDLIDVFLFVGLIGFLIYFLFYLKILTFRETKGMSFVHLSFVITWLSASALVGHQVFSAINGPYLAIIITALSSRKLGQIRAFDIQANVS